MLGGETGTMTTSNHNEPRGECNHVQGCGTAPGSPEADSPVTHPITSVSENKGEKSERGSPASTTEAAPETGVAQSTDTNALSPNYGALVSESSGESDAVLPPGQEPISEGRHGSVDPPPFTESMWAQEPPVSEVAKTVQSPLGQSLAEIERARQEMGQVRGTLTGFERIVPPLFRSAPVSSRDVQIAEDVLGRRELDKRDLFNFNYGAAETPDRILEKNKQFNENLDALTKRAIDDFLGTGTHRTHALRGFLRFLTQGDLATVLVECAVLIDDEHLRESVRMLGPDDLQAVNWAAGDEIGIRMIDAEVPQGFVRPLTAEDKERETVVFSRNGNPVLEKDVEHAVEVLDEVGSWRDEGELAQELERRTGWNSPYAGEVAVEAWKRYYQERECESEDETKD